MKQQKKQYKHDPTDKRVDVQMIALVVVCVLALLIVYFIRTNRLPRSSGKATDSSLTVTQTETYVSSDGELEKYDELPASGSDLKKD